MMDIQLQLHKIPSQYFKCVVFHQFCKQQNSKNGETLSLHYIFLHCKKKNGCTFVKVLRSKRARPANYLH